MPHTYKNQSYSSIKKKCVGQGTLFEDPEFPASAKSLYHTKLESDDNIQWLRPKELCRVPKLVVEGLSSDDLVCDDVTRSWFATACIALAKEPKLWYKVVPESTKQEWDDKNQYAGIFKFHLWRFGEWIEVVVDDRLPVREGKLVYCRSSAKNEFWSALLEKAYAKLFGDYESMAQGQAGDAVVDFTGGVSEKVILSDLDPTAKAAVFHKLKDACENKALMNCRIVLPMPVLKKYLEEGRTPDLQSDPTLIGASGPHGLINGLGYNITMVKEIQATKGLQSKIGSSNLRLLRLFTPGGGSKWTGPWSAKSQEMGMLSTNEWEKIGIKYEKEEEFWMSYHDFSNIFTTLDVCHFLNKSFFSLKKQWHETVLFSGWTNSGLNGGNTWDDDMVLRNPQFMFDVTSETDTPVVSIEQRDVKGDGISDIENFDSIGFYIMKVEPNRKFRIHIKGEQVFKSKFVKARSSFGRAELSKGRYVVFPCCQKRGTMASFMFRLYTGNNPSCVELKKDCPDAGCCLPTFRIVTTIEVTKVDGLALPPNEKGSLDPFVVIICEGQKVTSDFKKNTASPVFNTKATFYRKSPEKPIIVEIYNRNRLINSFLCEARIDLPGKRPSVSSSAGKRPSVSSPAGKRPSVSSPAGKRPSVSSPAGKRPSLSSPAGKRPSASLPAGKRPSVSLSAGGEEGTMKVFDVYGKKKEADVQKPGKVYVNIQSSNDLALL